MIVGVKTENKQLNAIAEIPFIGGLFIFIVIFIVPVICSFLCQAFIPLLHNDIGFTKALLILLPGWNLILWFSKIKLYIFFLPAWALLGGFALLKIIRMIFE